jgi:ribonuclease HII
MRIRPNFAFEHELWGRGVTSVAGVDEVGVGAFAGPVVAAAVILAPLTIIDGLADSKMLSPKRREKLFAVISAGAVAMGIGHTDVEEVDRLNIYWAAMEARRRAVEALPSTPAHILVDGKRRITGCHVPQTAVVDGDALSASIAAASIVAKVTRDAIMEEYAELYPGYGFERHKGYGTADHISTLTRLGPLRLHRWSFEPVWRAGTPQPQLALWTSRKTEKRPG